MKYRPASIFKRFVALLIDGMIIHVVAKLFAFPLGFTFDPLGIFNHGWWGFAEYSGWTGLIGVLYYIFLESSSKSATFGKQAMGLIVLDEQGNNVTLGKSIIRNVTKVLCGNIFVIGYFFAFFTKDRQALHDLLGTTLVVENQQVEFIDKYP